MTSPWFKFEPNAWLQGTRHLTPEQRGIYIDLICLLMIHDGDLRNDDDWMRHQLHTTKQRWRKNRDQLIEHQKIKVVDGKICNDRCTRELAALLDISAKRSQSIQKRWKKPAENLAESSQKPAENFQVSDEKPESFSRKNPEKSNDFNDSNDTNEPLHARVLDIDIDKEEDKSPPMVPPFAGGDDQKSFLSDEPVSFDQAGQLHVSNGRRVELEELLGKRAVASTLKAITPVLPRGLPPNELWIAVQEACRQHKAEKDRKTRDKAKRTRLPENWVLPDDWLVWAVKEQSVPADQVRREAMRFKRYWTSADAKNPLKADWDRTWRNWIEAQIQRGYLKQVLNAQLDVPGSDGFRYASAVDSDGDPIPEVVRMQLENVERRRRGEELMLEFEDA